MREETELQLLFLVAGFDVDAVFGDYACGPLMRISQQMIVIGRRAIEAGQVETHQSSDPAG